MIVGDSGFISKFSAANKSIISFQFFSFPVFLVIVISGQSTPAALKEDIQLLKYEHDNNPDGSYKFG